MRHLGQRMQCPDDQLLAEVLDGSLSVRRRDELEQHIDVCAACRVELSLACRLRGSAGTDLVEASADDELPGVGTHVGRYQLCDVLGAGSMGVVYEARDPELDRRIAIKILRDELMPGAGGDLRLRAEAQTLARISHPNVVAVYDVGRVGGRRFLAMELVNGTTLRDHLAQHRWARRDRLRVLVDIGRGLAAAHVAGIVHRDLKPDNVLIGTDGRPRISDFGLARTTIAAGSGGVGAVVGPSVESDARQRGYLAPEVRAGKRTTTASDQYAFATMCWETLLDARPVAPVVVPGRPRDLHRVLVVLARGLSEDPAARWPSVTALVDALVAAARRPRRRWPVTLAVIAAAAAVAAVVLVAARGRGATEREPAACRGIEARAAAMWTPARAQAMRDAFAHSDLASATTFADIADAGMRRVSDAWRTTALAVCRRDPARFASGAGAAACLERRYGQSDSLAVLFASVDQTLIERSIGAVAGLASSASCLDAHELREPPRPAEWLALVRRLAAAGADIDLGRTDIARADAESMIRDAAAANLPALHAEATLILAEVERVSGNFAEAHRLIEDAIIMADQSSADLVRARGLIELGRLAARDLMRPDEAAESLTLARAAVARLGEPPATAIMLAQTEADLAMVRGQPSVAIEHLRHALDVIRESGMTWWEIPVHNDLASAYVAEGQFEQALGELERNLAASAGLAPGRILAAMHMNVAGALWYLDRLDEAIQHSELAATMLRATGESRLLAQLLGNLGYHYAADGRWDLALASAEDSLHMTARVLGGAHPDVALRTTNLADLQRDTGHPDEAAVHYRRACELYTAALGDDALALADPLISLAEIDLDAGRTAAALAAAERTIELRRAALAAGREPTAAWLADTQRAEDVLARARAAARRHR